MTTTSDKVVLTQYPIAPAKCCVCNFSADGHRKFVDFQMSLDIYGSVNICENCCVNIAELLDYVARDKNEDDLVEVLNSKVAELQEENARLNHTLDAILDTRPATFDRLSANGGQSEDGDDSPDLLSELESREGSRDSEDAEPDASRGFKNLVSTESNGDSD